MAHNFWQGITKAEVTALINHFGKKETRMTIDGWVVCYECGHDVAEENAKRAGDNEFLCNNCERRFELEAQGATCVTCVYRFDPECMAHGSVCSDYEFAVPVEEQEAEILKEGD